jgi:1,5-anhydro-D-fructose reductase (1,5-anhydro-D-mannitol-forming)
MNKTLKVGIAGYAPFGKNLANHFKAIDGVEIAGVFNRGEERRKQAEADGFQTFDDYGKLLALPGLDAVVIATANLVHAEQCMAAARAGKHVFCEKPLALDLESYDRIVSTCRSAGVITHLDFTMRFGAGTRRFAELVRGGHFGRILSLWVRRCRGYGLWAAGKRHPDIVHPEVSGGWNLHHNVHGTDMLLYLAGSRVTEVYCKQLKSAADTPCEEIILAMVTFASGALGYVGDSISIQREDYLGVIGEKGSAVVRHGGEIVIKMEDGRETTEVVPVEKGYSRACQAFTDACLGKGNGNIPFEEGRHSLEVLLAMNRSAAQGQIVRL